MIVGGSICAGFPAQDFTMPSASAPSGSADLPIFNSWTPSAARYAGAMAGEATAAAGGESAARQRS